MSEYLSFYNLNENPFPDINDTISEDEYLAEKETGAYIRRQLRKAGMKDQVFSASAIKSIYLYSGGDLSLINKICDFALRRGYVKKIAIIREKLLVECLELLGDSKPPEHTVSEKRRHKRLKTELDGTFLIHGTKVMGRLTVTNISVSGVQLKLNRQRIIKVGDRLIISIKSDNESLGATGIRRIVAVRNTFGFFAGCAFIDSNTDEFLNFYKYISSRRSKKKINT